MDKIIDEILTTHKVRKSKKQKTNFINRIKMFADENDYDFKVEKGLFGSRNIVLGNADTSKVIYSAHYDTPFSLGIPNIITPKNKMLYILYQLAMLPMLLIPFCALFLMEYLIELILNKLLFSETMFFICGFLLTIFEFFLFFKILFGIPNKNNSNDNTSGVSVLLETIKNIPANLKDKVCFVFFDLEEYGLIGSYSFSRKYKNKLLINFDTVADGREILIKTKSKDLIENLKKAYVSNKEYNVEILTKEMIFPSDHANFKNGVGVTATKLSKKKKINYIDRIHTSKDVIFDKKNIEFLVKSNIVFTKIICEE